jgi:tetratricopeptide (TPR) repeat protein
MRGRLCIEAEEFEKALENFHAARDLALKVRPDDGDTSQPLWTESDEEDFGATLRYPVMILWRKLDRPAVALDEVQSALDLLPADKSLNNMKSAIAGQIIGGVM